MFLHTLQNHFHSLTSQYTLHSQYLSEQLSIIHESLSPLRLTSSQLLHLTLRKFLLDLYNLTFSLPALHLFLPPLILYLIFLYHKQPYSEYFNPYFPTLQRPPGIHPYDYPALLTAGLQNFPTVPYILSYSGYKYIVFPSSYFDEIKRIPPEKASMIEWFTEVFFQGWRFLGRHESGLYKAVGVDLARAVSGKVKERQMVVREVCQTVIGEADEWKSVKLFETSLDVVGRTNSIGLIGGKLGSDKRWLKGLQYFVMAIMTAVFGCHAVPTKILRRVVAPVLFAPAWGLYWWMRWLLKPVVEAAISGGRGTGAEKGVFPLSEWLLKRYGGIEAKGNIEGQIEHDLIVACFESTPSMAGTLYMILRELVVREELVEELRREVEGVEGEGKELPDSSLGELRKMDSVMRESARVNPFAYLTLFRKVTQRVDLSGGLLLRKGSLICVDAYHIVNSPELWENPETFDPMRFLKLRQKPGQENMHQFTSLGADSPGWGDGLQACPGRAFAGNTLKIILTELLINYDIKLPEGKGKPGRNSMPNGSMAPDMNARILIRKRQR